MKKSIGITSPGSGQSGIGQPTLGEEEINYSWCCEETVIRSSGI